VSGSKQGRTGRHHDLDAGFVHDERDQIAFVVGKRCGSFSPRFQRDVFVVTLSCVYRASIRRPSTSKSFVLRKVQPGLLGLMDGAVSTLAPLFAPSGLTRTPENAFFVGLAASLGAGVSLGLAEALSDDGTVTGRGGPLLRGAITGVSTAIGGMLHTFPFLISDLNLALKIAYAVVVAEMIMIAYIRFRFMSGNLWTTIGQVIVGGGIVFGIGIWLGRIGAS
jgi:erythrin-vacuolar iron transport family protein